MDESLATLVREQRHRLDLSVDALAALAGVSRERLVAFEQGESVPPRDFLWRVVRALRLDLSFDDLPVPGPRASAEEFLATFSFTILEWKSPAERAAAYVKIREAVLAGAFQGEWDRFGLPATFSAFDRWIRRNRSEASRWLPRLLQLDGPDIDEELVRHPELQPGITIELLGRIEDAFERDPMRAHELTTILVKHAALGLPWRNALMGDLREADVWAAHARVLFALGRDLEALDAISRADAAVEERYMHRLERIFPEAELIEAQVFSRRGDPEFARSMLDEHLFLEFGKDKAYVSVRMIESQTYWDAGDQAAAAIVWKTVADESLEKGKLVRVAHLDSQIGVFLLRRGLPEEAARRFQAALERFAIDDCPEEATEARWGLARAATACRRFDEAIPHFHRVQAELLSQRNVLDAAIVSTELLDLLLGDGRNEELLRFAAALVRTFTNAGMSSNRIDAWRFVRRRALSRELTREDVASVRGYFNRLPLRPNATFARS